MGPGHTLGGIATRDQRSTGGRLVDRYRVRWVILPNGNVRLGVPIRQAPVSLASGSSSLFHVVSGLFINCVGAVRYGSVSLTGLTNARVWLSVRPHSHPTSFYALRFNQSPGHNIRQAAVGRFRVARRSRGPSSHQVFRGPLGLRWPSPAPVRGTVLSSDAWRRVISHLHLYQAPDQHKTSPGYRDPASDNRPTAPSKCTRAGQDRLRSFCEVF